MRAMFSTKLKFKCIPCTRLLQLHCCRSNLLASSTTIVSASLTLATPGQVEVVTPEDHMGDVIGDLNSRRGMVSEFLDKPGGLKVIRAEVPLSEMFQYVSVLRGMTKGRAQYTMTFEKYDNVPNQIQEKIVADNKVAA